MNAAVGRRLLAEFTGTGLLVAVVVGSGIAATRLTTDGALRLLVNSVVTAFGLAVLIVVFIQASGAHFNPVVTAADWLLGRRTARRYRLGLAAAVMACQIAGAIAGSALADAMFAEPVLSPSHHHPGGAPILLSEVVATAGLLFVSSLWSGPAGSSMWRGRWVPGPARRTGSPPPPPSPTPPSPSADPHQHLRRDRPGIGACVHRRPAPRRRDRHAPGHHPLPGPARPVRAEKPAQLVS